MSENDGLNPAEIVLIVLDAILVAVLVVILVTWPNGARADDASPNQATQPASQTATAGAGEDPDAGGSGDGSEDSGSDQDQSTEASEVSVPKDAHDYDSFVMPSGNIWCTIGSDSTTCTIKDFSFSPPSLPGCDAKLAGHTWQVSADEAGPACPEGGKISKPKGAKELAYGDSTTVGDFLCESDQKGVTCRAISTGHGFEIAREGTRSF